MKQARDIYVRRKQQHRATRDIRAGLDRDDLGHGKSFSFACALDLIQISNTQAGNVHSSAGVAIGVVVASPRMPLPRPVDFKHQGPHRVLTHLTWLTAGSPSPTIQEKLAYF